MNPANSGQLRSASLMLERQRVVRYQQFRQPLSFDKRGCFGFRFVVNVAA